MAASTLSKGAEKALGMFEDGLGFHNNLRERADRLYEAYEGKLKIPSDAAQWTSKLHPPYINHIIETSLAGIVDDRLQFRVKPQPRFYDAGEFEQATQGARAHEILMRQQLAHDRFNTKIRDLVLQAAVAGFTVAKTFWRRDPATRNRLVFTDDMRLATEQYTSFAYNGPCTEVCDIRDWGCHESTVDIQRSPFVWHRVWEPFERLKQLEKQGIYRNVDELKGSKGVYEQEGEDRSKVDHQRTKDMIEVLEIWYRTPEGIRVVTLGDRKVELRADRPNPFWHGRYPFTLGSIQPGLFRLGGVSPVEKIMHLQEATWDLMNQTHDNVRFINNAIQIVPDDMIDTERDYVPGAQWIVDGDANRVQMWSPEPITAQVALPHLTRLEQQMQNLAGSQPFTTTSEGMMSASTATEASLITNLAQRSLVAQKQQIYHMYRDIGQMRLELNQQFIRVPMMVEQIGVDNQAELTEIGPLLLQGDYLFDIEPMSESLFRQERKAEAQGVMQMALGAAPVFAAYSQAGVGAALNLQKHYEEFLKSNDVQDTDPYFISQPAPAPPAPGGQQAPMGAAPEGPGGVTAPQSIAPETSPSNQSSISPEVFLQRALASRGG